jgi:hypothetical protein
MELLLPPWEVVFCAQGCKLLLCDVLLLWKGFGGLHVVRSRPAYIGWALFVRAVTAWLCTAAPFLHGAGAAGLLHHRC